MRRAVFLFLFTVKLFAVIETPKRIEIDSLKPSTSVADTTVGSVNGADTATSGVVDFFDPIVEFLFNYPAQFFTILALTSLLFYLFVHLPALKRTKTKSEEEIDISEMLNGKDNGIKREFTPISQSLYSKISGEINEAFLYEKERVLLDESLSSNDRDREIMKLEWRVNQLLNFSLPKLISQKRELFREGVEELSRDPLSKKSVENLI
jgi:hypothetical protein